METVFSSEPVCCLLCLHSIHDRAVRLPSSRVGKRIGEPPFAATFVSRQSAALDAKRKKYQGGLVSRAGCDLTVGRLSKCLRGFLDTREIRSRWIQIGLLDVRHFCP